LIPRGVMVGAAEEEAHAQRDAHVLGGARI